MMKSNNPKFIYYGFIVLAFFFGLAIGIGAYQIKRKLDSINKNPYLTQALISEEFIENLGKKQTVNYKLEYYVDKKLYVRNINTSGDYNTSQKIEIIVNRNNPENYLILNKINYQKQLIISVIFFLVSLLMFSFRKKVIYTWEPSTNN